LKDLRNPQSPGEGLEGVTKGEKTRSREKREADSTTRENGLKGKEDPENLPGKLKRRNLEANCLGNRSQQRGKNRPKKRPWISRGPKKLAFNLAVGREKNKRNGLGGKLKLLETSQR